MTGCCLWCTSQPAVTHNSAQLAHDSAYYNRELLIWRRSQLGLKIVDVSRLLGIRVTTVSEVFRGRATNKHLYPVAHFLGLDWAKVHELDLKEPDFPSAVRNSHSQGAATYSTAMQVAQ